MGTPMHACAIDWASRLIDAMTTARAIERNSISLLFEELTRGFTGAYHGVTKVPDLGLAPGARKRPTIIFQIGYTQQYQNLKEDAKIFLEGTQGEITKVVLVKLEPLRSGEEEIQKGFVELWHFENGRAKIQGGRKRLFPPTRSHQTQRLTFTLGEILGEEFSNLALEGWEEDDIIELSLDPLRHAINQNTERYLK